VHSRILDRYLIKEMLMTWLAVTAVLLVIMVSNVLARSLSKVTEGAIAGDALLSLVAVKSVSSLVTLIPLGLYLGVLLAHGRFYRDNEISVMQACGAGWRALFRPTAQVGVLAVVLIAVLTIFVSPWAARTEQSLKQSLQEESGVGLLSAGKFVESSDGKAVFFTQFINQRKTQFENVFMYRQRGYQIDKATGNEYLVLTDGQTAIGQAGQAEYTITTFKRQGVLRPRRDTPEMELRHKSKTMTQLLDSATLGDKAELQWRVSVPLAALLLALLAVPLGYTSPRQGRFAKIALAILIYIPYANFLALARKSIASGAIPPWVGLWPVHIVVVALIIALLIRRVGWHWLRTQGWKGL